MITSKEAKANARAALDDTPRSNCAWLEREDLEALLDHIGNLEFEVSRLKGTFNVLEEH